MKLPSVQHILTESIRSFRRFPFAILAGAVFSITAIYLTEFDFNVENGRAVRLLMVSLLGISLFTVTVLAGEKRSLSRRVVLALQGAGALLLFIYYLALPDDPSEAAGRHMIRFILFFLGMHLLVAWLPYAGDNQRNGFWQYNKSLFLRFLTAVLYSGVLFVGLSVALLSIDQLFGVEIMEERYVELWFLMAGIFNTWFFLSGVPEDLDALEEVGDYPKGLKVFTQYVLIPLVAVYVMILYGYTVKIVMEWEWPEGWVANLVLGFSIVGILALLLLHPIRNRVDHGWVKTISRNYYIALLPLVVLLLLAIWVRLSEYSFTENRYFVLVAGFWLGAISLYFIFSNANNIKLIPASLAVVVFLSSFGPWSAFSVSERSQINRLEGYLSDNGMLTDGTIHPVSDEIPMEDAREISAIFRYLIDIHGLDGIKPWLDRDSALWETVAAADSTGTDLRAETIVEKLGVDYISRWESKPSLYRTFSASKPDPLAVGEYDWLIANLDLNSGRSTEKVSGGEREYRIRLLADSTALTLNSGQTADSTLITVGFKHLIERLNAEYGVSNSYEIPPGEMTVTAENDRIRLVLAIRHIQARRTDGVWSIQNLRLSMLFAIEEE